VIQLKIRLQKAIGSLKGKKWREVNASDLPSRIMESFHLERIEYLPTYSRTLKATTWECKE
jgi:hypothetical protein